MRTNLGLSSAALLLLVLIIAIPAVYADVKTVTLDKTKFSINDSFTIVGTVDDTETTDITAVLDGPSVKKLIRSALSLDGAFTFTPVNAKDFFRSDGTYTINVFTALQKPINGTIIKIEYDDKVAIILPDFELVLNPIGNKQVKEAEKLSFTASITDSKITNEEFTLKGHPNGAAINKNTGVFTWTPTETQSGGYIFDVIVNAGPLEEKESITVTVLDKPRVIVLDPTKLKPPVTEPEPEPEPTTPEPPAQLGVASFVDGTKDPQNYVNRYNTEPSYKKWFDDNFSEYDSIYQAVGLEEPLGVASFVDSTKDPQSYVNRYNTEPSYKKWFDDNFSEYDSIYQAVGLEIAGGTPDPSSATEPDSSSASTGTDSDTIPPEEEFGECGVGTDLIDGMCIIIDDSEGDGGGCLIATAAYGSEMAPQVQLLREIRDNQLMSTGAGTSFMAGFNQLYYSFSPHIADMQRENPAFREMVKIGITPLLSTLPVMSHAQTESEVVSYGIGVILLNLGMYMGIPTVIILTTKNYIIRTKNSTRYSKPQLI